MSVVRYALRDNVAILTLNNPPVNALSAQVRQGLMDGMQRAAADGAISILINADGRTYSAGADISEFGQPPVGPSLPDVLNLIEASKIPVVAAIQGPALGGGFELALAAHYRIASRSARVGLPEVTLGLLPGAGGTQRLPRLVGASLALDLILSGQPIDADAAAQQGMLDDVVDGALDEAGMIWASRVAADGLGARPTRDATAGTDDPAAFMADIAAWRAALDAHSAQSTSLIIGCVEAALLLPFDTGLRRERAVFKDLLASDRARGLRHAFAAERAAARMPAGSDGLPRDIAACTVLGGGILGASITLKLLDAGIATTLIETDDDTLAAAVGRILDVYDRAVARAELDADARDSRIARLSGATANAGAAGSDLIIYAAPEDGDRAGQRLSKLATAASGNPILAVARDLNVQQVAAASGRAGSVAAMVVHPPLRANPLVEISVVPGALPEVAPSLLALSRKLGLNAVLAGANGSGTGLIAGRLRGAMRQAGEQLLIAGAAPSEVDTALRNWGFRLGPFEAEDRLGLAAARDDYARTSSDRDSQLIGTPLADALLAAGRTGRASGAGWYDYTTPGAGAQQDPGVTAILQDLRGTPGAPPDAGQIVLHTLAAMANAGAWMLADGIARRPLDIDVAALSGLGMARARGGPMLAVDLVGLAQVAQMLKSMTTAHPGAWTPALQWSELIKSGRTFADLNG